MSEWLLGRWPLKLLALVLASAIWLAITSEVRIPQDYPVPLEVSLSDELILSGAPPSTVSVRLRGPESLVRDIDQFRLAFRVDLQDAVPGQRSVLLTRDRLTGVPRGIEVIRIDPDRISFEIDRRLRRTLPVAPSFQGSPPPGYAFYDARVFPESLDVEGPEAEVKPLLRLRTEPIRLDGRTEPFTLRVAAVPDSPEVRVMDTRRPEISVSIDEAPLEKIVEDVPVILAGESYETEVRPPTLLVVLWGAPRLLDEIGPDRIRAVADVSGLAPGPKPHDVPVRVDLTGLSPRDVGRLRVKSVSPRTATVYVFDTRIVE